DRNGTRIAPPFNAKQPRFSPDGNLLVSMHGDDEVQLHTAADASLVWRRSGNMFVIDSERSRILVGHANNLGSRIESVEIDSGEQSVGRNIAVPGYLRDISISPDQLTLASIANDSHVRLWSLATGEQLDASKSELAQRKGARVEYS